MTPARAPATLPASKPRRNRVEAGPILICYDGSEGPWDGIVEVADDIGAEAIIGTSGFTAARELLHGSGPHQMAEHAGRAVILAPPPDPRAKQ
jgi:nucleotide-binding universal stress UspA family protein